MSNDITLMLLRNHKIIYFMLTYVSVIYNSSKMASDLAVCSVCVCTVNAVVNLLLICYTYILAKCSSRYHMSVNSDASVRLLFALYKNLLNF
jgi:hypothetical protein